MGSTVGFRPTIAGCLPTRKSYHFFEVVDAVIQSYDCCCGHPCSVPRLLVEVDSQLVALSGRQQWPVQTYWYQITLGMRGRGFPLYPHLPCLPSYSSLLLSPPRQESVTDVESNRGSCHQWRLRTIWKEGPSPHIYERSIPYRTDGV